MKKLIKPQDILLLGLAGIGDIFEEIRDPLMLYGKAYESMYGFIPKRYKRHSFIKSVSRSLKTGYIEKIEKNGEMYIRLTKRGAEKSKRDFSLLTLSKAKWDKKWRIVFFDIEETSRVTRNKLRVKLKELGLAMLQKSVWVTPHDIMVDFYEFIEKIGLEERVFLFQGEALLAGDQKELARKLWQLDKLNEKYKVLEEEIREIKQLAAGLDDRTKMRDMKAEGPGDGKTEDGGREDGGREDARPDVWLSTMEERTRKLKMSYLSTLAIDPHLPTELLPSDWVRAKVAREFKTL